LRGFHVKRFDTRRVAPFFTSRQDRYHKAVPRLAYASMRASWRCPTRVLVVHGNDPKEHLERHFGVGLVKGEFRRCIHAGNVYHVYAETHFSRIAGGESAMEPIGQRIKNHIR
ncbi:MAG TPA: hypothetical protein QF564_25880, partial [Pirellulaceae bacterium]|nr:hypothetical protein [Pirellulaceae bacterium]